MHKLEKLIAERIASGLKRKSINTCSRWAMSCRIMGKPYVGPWTFKHHPWLREMHDSEAEFNVGQKSAQMGYSETVLNRTFFKIDIEKVDCLYVLPSQTPDATNFSAGRFDPALEMSEHLMNMFSDVKNVGHKRAGATNLYVRGSKSRSGLKSIPTGFIVLDEVDEMDEDNIPLAMERAAGQIEKQIWAVSTPTTPGFGINKLFLTTTQEHFFFKCPLCSRFIELTFPESLEITATDWFTPGIENSFLKCSQCKGKLPHETKSDWLAKGKWIPTFDQREARGFYINQLYSSTVSPLTIAQHYFRAQRDLSEEQELYNSKLGLEHIVKGAGVTETDIQNSIGNHRNSQKGPKSGIITMGVDIGRWIHYEIDHWYFPEEYDTADLNSRAKPKVISFGKVREFEELDLLMYQFGINAAVVDIQPERRKAFEFANRFFGRVKLCFYAQGVTGKKIHVAIDDEATINVDRTSWLDLSLGRFKRTDGIKIPMDVDLEYKSHMKALVRTYEKDKSGNPVGRYTNGSQEDHYAHARNYAEIALFFAVSSGNPQDIIE